MNRPDRNLDPTTRIPSLDGLRAVSITLVIFSHVLQTYHWTQSVPFVWRLTPGATGVSIFFVISGYLISTLLLRERAKTGKIRLPAFFFRRFFRIVPAYLVYLSAMAVLKSLGVVTVDWHHFVYALLYVTNYTHVNWVLLHTWSLSVEEQFYLLFPVLLVRSGPSTLRMALIATVGVSVLARLFNQVMGLWPIDATYSFEGRADQLAFGCLCALLHQSSNSTFKSFLTRFALPASALLLCLAIALPVGEARTVFFNTLVGAGVALLIHACTTQPTLWLTRLLEVRLLRMLGLMSYSLYLWQQIWMAPELKFSLPVALTGALFCGAMSFRFVEKTGLKLRRRVEEKLRTA